VARARNEGRLFSRIEWPKDPEIVSILEAPFLQFLQPLLLCSLLYKGSFILFVVTGGASKAVAPSSHCKGLCS
jgi:hypothetical protein